MSKKYVMKPPTEVISWLERAGISTGNNRRIVIEFEMGKPAIVTIEQLIEDISPEVMDIDD